MVVAALGAGGGQGYRTVQLALSFRRPDKTVPLLQGIVVRTKCSVRFGTGEDKVHQVNTTRVTARIPQASDSLAATAAIYAAAHATIVHPRQI